MIKIKSVLIAASLIMGLALPATAQIGEPRQNFSVGFNGGVNLNSASFTPKIKQNSLMGITGGLTARYISEKYFAMICGAQVELNISQRGWDELFEIMDANGQTVEDPTRSYTRKMTYIDIPFLAHLAFGKERGLQFFVNAGPQIGLLISESESMENIDMNKLTDTQKAVYGDKIQNKFDYGIAGGGGIEFRTKKAGSLPARRTLLFCIVRLLQYNEKDYFSRAGSWHNHGEIHLSIRSEKVKIVEIKKQARSSRLFFISIKPLPMPGASFILLPKSVCSLHHHFITSDSTNSQHVQNNGYQWQTKCPTNTEQISVALQCKIESNKGNIITYQQQTIEDRHANL